MSYDGPERRESSGDERAAWRQANLLRARVRDVFQVALIVATAVVAVLGSHYTLRQDIALIKRDVAELKAELVKLEHGLEVTREEERTLEQSVGILEERTKRGRGNEP